MYKLLILCATFLILSAQAPVPEPSTKTQDHPLYLFMLSYINEYKSDKCDNPEELAAWYYELGTQYNIPPLILLSHARPESGFWDGDIGSRGERGTLQIGKCHRNPIKKAGLDWYDERDRIEWGCIMISTSINKGKTLYQAMSPWGTKLRGNESGPAGWPEYLRLQKEYDEWTNKLK